MLIQIEKCSSEHFWYKDLIISIIEIDSQDDIMYYKNGNAILKSDCRVISQEKKDAN